jgi:hypothetical protein
LSVKVFWEKGLSQLPIDTRGAKTLRLGYHPLAPDPDVEQIEMGGLISRRIRLVQSYQFEHPMV